MTSTTITANDLPASFLYEVLVDGVQQKRILSTRKEIHISNNPAENQIFTLTSSKMVVWENIPDSENFEWLYFQIFKGNSFTERMYHDKVVKNNDHTKIFSLPDLPDGAYRFAFYGSKEYNIKPFEQYRLPLTVVLDGKYYFSEMPLTQDSLLAKQLDDCAKEYLSDKKAYVGISIGIVKSGDVLFLNYGYFKKGESKPTEHSIYGIGSISKTFTGIVMAYLSNKGMLSLYDPLDMYLDFPLPKYNNEIAIRLIDLITHTSGLPRDPSELPTASVWWKMTYEEMFEALKLYDLKTKPGEVYQYSNIGYILLGYVIEKITGKEYSQVVKEILFGKFDMKNTTILLNNDEQKSLFAPSYYFNNIDCINPFMYENIWQSAGGIKSSAYDMTKYIMANLSQVDINDALLEKTLIDAQKVFFIDKNDPKSKIIPRIGLGWRYNTQYWNIYGDYNYSLVHGGSNYHTSHIQISHHIDAGIIILRNNGHTENEVNGKDDIILNELAVNLLRVIRDNY